MLEGAPSKAQVSGRALLKPGEGSGGGQARSGQERAAEPAVERGARRQRQHDVQQRKDLRQLSHGVFRDVEVPGNVGVDRRERQPQHLRARDHRRVRGEHAPASTAVAELTSSIVRRTRNRVHLERNSRDMSDLFDFYPYAERLGVNRRLPERGRPREEILSELRAIAIEEDAVWEAGGCSGTMYCGDHQHYAFLKEAFGLFAHQNALQRDMCPSATRFEGEIVAMALDLFNAGVVGDSEPAGMVTSGGTASITHAMLVYREDGRERRGIAQPNVIKPETAHPAFDKACHLFGIELRRAPVDPATTLVRVDAVAELIDANTVALVGSAGNYGYGTIDPIAELAALASERGTGMHVDGCLGGFLLPFGEELGYPIAAFDFRVPGVTSISADTHKYGYGLKGTSTLLFRDRALRNRCYFFMADWSGGKYFSPGMEGSRSDGLLAATWASLVSIGREGYREHAKGIFETSAAMQDAVRSHPELRLLG